MDVSVPNRPPYFTDGTTTFGTVTVSMNSVKSVTIPGFADLDLNIPTLTYSKGTSISLSASLVGTTSIKISPTSYSEVGSHST
jgi:hypothetical protein